MANAKPQQDEQQAESAMLTVSAKREGFHRAGRAWSTKPVTVSSSDFDPEQLEQLKSCPGMIVIEGAAPPPAPDAPGQSGRVAELEKQLEKAQAEITSLSGALSDEVDKVAELTAKLEAATQASTETGQGAGKGGSKK